MISLGLVAKVVAIGVVRLSYTIGISLASYSTDTAEIADRYY